MRPLVCVLLLAPVLVLGKPAAGSGSSSTDADDPTAIKSPQLLYMERLHNLLKNTQEVPKEKENKMGGLLLATSFEAENLMGQGNTDDGLDITSGKTYTMQFSIPREKEASVIQSAELWLFPLVQSVESHVQLTLLVTVELDHANRPRTEVIEVKWNKKTECISLNLTSLSKKISKNIQKRDLEEANITVTIEVVHISSQAETSLDSYFTDMCNALAQKQTNTPFLVVKYYMEEPTNSNTPNLRAKRNPMPTSRSSYSSNCSVIPLVIDMTKLFGEYIISPKQLDVSNCYGFCDLYQNSESFNNHASILERYKLAREETIKREPSCVPISYDSVDLLLYQEGYFIIAKFPDMIVTDCGCR